MAHEQTIQIGPLMTRASIAAPSINRDERTVEVVWSTGVDVERYDYSTGERYIERLSMKPEHIRLQRLNQAAPVLDAHMGYSVRHMLGAVVQNSAKVVAKEGRATLQFSRRKEVEEGVWQDVQDGIVRSVSVGYDVFAYEETPAKKDRLKIRTAIDWEPYEVSMVPMPADIDALARNAAREQTHACRIITRGDEPTASQEQTAMDETRQQSEFVVEQTSASATADTRAAGAAAAEHEPNERDLGAQQERERVQGILSSTRAARLPMSYADKLIADPSMTLLRAQTAIFKEMERRDPEVPTRSAVPIQMGDDPLVHVRAGIQNAILHRVAPNQFKLDDKGREYRGMTLLDVAKAYSHARGIRTTGLSKMEIAGVALGINTRGALHTTSDFAELLADTASITLRRAYEEAPPTFGPIARRVTLPDFKPVKRLQLGEAPELLEVDEHGEFTRGTIGEGKEAFQLATYGRVFGITRKALVNDDTDAFGRIPQLFGRAARKLEANIIWQQITSNPTMGDGNALFSAAHNNLATDGDVISIASVSRARLAMRMQTAPDGSLLDVVPRFLVVPAALETVSDQLVAPVVAAQPGQVNPFTGRLQVITEPRLDANSSTAWYLFASPDALDIIEYAYLEGEEGPMVESRVGFDVDGLEIKARLDFAAKVIDWRGIYKDPGENVS